MKHPLIALSHLTYRLEHSPNCPSPYLIRLVAPRGGYIDGESPLKTKDLLAYGRTLEASVEEALKLYEKKRRK